MIRSDNIDQIAAALVQAQPQFHAAKKDGENPHFRSRFATLEAVIEAVRTPLAENGLSYLQMPVHSEGGIGLTTILVHTSGQMLGATMSLPFDTQKGRSEVQAAGSTISYMRRYALMSLLGIATEDDDGQKTHRVPSMDDHEPRKSYDNVDRATQKQIAMFRALCSKMELDDEDISRGLDKYGHSKFSELSKKDASTVLSALKDREKEMQT